ncbi:Holliday junction branch migration protein RuvA [soil metagenome]
MIATLSGVIDEKMAETIVIDVNGVGYGVLVPYEDYGKLETGDRAKLYVYEHIRDNSHDLYGFTLTATKRLFEQLLDVNGVGPKMALNILGIGSVEDVRSAIARGDIKFITAAPGVGKRVAERVVMELKDKIGLVSTVDSDSLFLGSAAVLKDEAVQALVSLGYNQADAVERLKTVDGTLSTEERVRLALRAGV